jgi:hypothetical protein
MFWKINDPVWLNLQGGNKLPAAVQDTNDPSIVSVELENGTIVKAGKKSLTKRDIIKRKKKTIKRKK